MKILPQTTERFSPVKDARSEVIGISVSFGILVWAIIGEYLVGVYEWTTFLLMFLIPFIHLLRFKDLDGTSFPYAPKVASLFFDSIYPILILVVTFASIPSILAISGILTEDTFLHIVFTGAVGHTGIHHGWAGWYLVTEGYLYHRLNRHAVKRKNIGASWRNGLLVVGFFLFIDDFWSEQLTDGVLGWPDVFHSINAVFPFSWRINFTIEIVILVLITLIGSAIYYHFKSKVGSIYV